MQDDYNLPEIGFVQQILSLNLVPRKNATCGNNDTSLCDFSGKIRSALHPAVCTDISNCDLFVVVCSYKVLNLRLACDNVLLS